MVQVVDTSALQHVLAEVESWEPPTVAVGVTTADAVLASHGPGDALLWFA